MALLQGLKKKFANANSKLLRICTETGNVSKLEKLLASNKELDLASIKFDGRTVLQVAVANCYIHIVRHLVEKCFVNVNDLGDNGETALHVACENNLMDIALYLISIQDIAPEICDKNGNMPSDLCGLTDFKILVEKAIVRKKNAIIIMPLTPLEDTPTATGVGNQDSLEIPLMLPTADDQILPIVEVKKLPIEEKTLPPVEKTPQTVEVKALPAVDEMKTLPLVEEEALSAIEETKTLPLVEEVKTLPPVEETLQTVEEKASPTFDEIKTLPSVEEEEILGKFEEKASPPVQEKTFPTVVEKMTVHPVKEGRTLPTCAKAVSSVIIPKEETIHMIENFRERAISSPPKQENEFRNAPLSEIFPEILEPEIPQKDKRMLPLRERTPKMKARPHTVDMTPKEEIMRLDSDELFVRRSFDVGRAKRMTSMTPMSVSRMSMMTPSSGVKKMETLSGSADSMFDLDDFERRDSGIILGSLDLDDDNSEDERSEYSEGGKSEARTDEEVTPRNNPFHANFSFREEDEEEEERLEANEAEGGYRYDHRVSQKVNPFDESESEAEDEEGDEEEGHIDNHIERLLTKVNPFEESESGSEHEEQGEEDADEGYERQHDLDGFEHPAEDAEEMKYEVEGDDGDVKQHETTYFDNLDEGEPYDEIEKRGACVRTASTYDDWDDLNMSDTEVDKCSGMSPYTLTNAVSL